MNVGEGFSRIALAIRYLGYGIGLLCAASGLIAAMSDSSSNQGGWIVIGVVCGAFFAGAGWTLAWIIEGFAQKKRES